MIAKRKPGRPTKARDTDVEKIREHLQANSLTHIARLEKIASKCYNLGIKNPAAYSKEIKLAADTYRFLLEAIGIKPRESLISISNNQNTLNAPGSPESFLAAANKAQEAKRLQGAQPILIEGKVVNKIIDQEVNP